MEIKAEKNILILITKGESGGAQTSVFNLAKSLREKNISVTVGLGEGQHLSTKLQEHGINHVRFSHLKRTHNITRIIAFIIEFKKFLKQHHFSTIHFNSTNTLFGVLSILHTKNKPKTIFTFRGLSILDKNYTQSILIKKLYLYIFTFLLRFVDEQVYVSKENFLQAKKLGIRQKAHVIYNGLSKSSLNFFTKHEAIEKLAQTKKVRLHDSFLVGSIGRLSYQKNYTFLIGAWSHIKKFIPNGKLVIIGDGPDKLSLQKEIELLGLNEEILLLGDIPEAHRFLKTFNFFVLPSRYEGMPIVLLETLFAGVPVIATDVNGNKEVIDDAGLLYELDNTDMFIKQVNNMLDPKKYRELSEQANKRSELFTIEKTTSEYTRLYV